jgi:hypothetical protein
MHRLAPIAVLVLLAAGCGGPLLFAELQVPTVRVTLPSQPFPAANDPSALCRDALGTVIVDCAQKELLYDLGAQVPVITEKGVSYQIRLTSLGIALAANDPMGDFGTVSAVQISVAGGGLPDVVVASYQQDPANPAPKSITVVGYSNLDLAPYVRSGTLDLRTEVHGIPPAFTADVAGTFYLEVKLDYGAVL